MKKRWYDTRPGVTKGQWWKTVLEILLNLVLVLVLLFAFLLVLYVSIY